MTFDLSTIDWQTISTFVIFLSLLAALFLPGRRERKRHKKHTEIVKKQLLTELITFEDRLKEYYAEKKRKDGPSFPAIEIKDHYRAIRGLFFSFPDFGLIGKEIEGELVGYFGILIKTMREKNPDLAFNAVKDIITVLK